MGVSGTLPRNAWLWLLFGWFLAGIAGGHELKLSGIPGEPAAEIILSSDGAVQGLVACFDWDPAGLTGTDLIAAPSLAQADLVIRRVERSFMVLGVVMDDDGVGGEIIPPGTAVLATARFQCPSAAAPPAVDLVFQDGKYQASAAGPYLENLITIGGQTISAREGLVLTDGKVQCPLLQPGKLRLGSAVGVPGAGCQPVNVYLDTPSPLEGFIIAVAHDPDKVSLREITVAGTVTASSGADFVSPRLVPGGGILQVVLDLEPPFLGNVIPAGNGQVIARYEYCCTGDLPPGSADSVTVLRFVDGVLGDPPVENLLVVGGKSLHPTEMLPGSFTCKAPGGEGTEFRCGPSVDPATSELPPIVGFPGSTVPVCFYYKSTPAVDPEETGEDRLQGLSMSVVYDPRWVRCKEGTFDIQGTITEAVGAEFINLSCENSTDDGDGGELILGILVDALPPFDGQTLPPTEDLLKIGCVDFEIAPEAACEACNDVAFRDEADGRGKVPIRNLVSIRNHSYRPALFDCQICVRATPVFQRGDCNWSRDGAYAVDIADPAVVISAIFLSGEAHFDPPCPDACDGNDDGRIDLADAVFLLRWLFRHGQTPPAPGPTTAGPDPTADRLDCEAGSSCP